jgi:hypothetical protein
VLNLVLNLVKNGPEMEMEMNAPEKPVNIVRIATQERGNIDLRSR